MNPACARSIGATQIGGAWPQVSTRRTSRPLEFRPLANASTRVAALLSGQVDFVLDPPVQDLARLRQTPGIKVWDGDEMRVTYVAMNQADELPHSDAKGRNPFKDPAARREILDRIVATLHEELYLIPLHRQKNPWAGRSSLSLVHMPNNWLVPIWVRMD